MRDVIVIGCGEHYRLNVGPSLSMMQAAGEINLIATVDVRAPGTPIFPALNSIPHVIRQDHQSLSACLSQYRDRKPVAILAHPHEYHAADASDLLVAGFDVILEKPYAITSDDLETVRHLVSRYPLQIALAEYYLMMKAAPLLQCAGLLNADSFYLTEPGYLESPEIPVENAAGMLASIGRPRTVLLDILEGEGTTGQFEHRGRQFADSRRGAGVILDLALHALAPLMALNEWLGCIPTDVNPAVEAAVCGQYLRFARNTYGVPAQYVPETYAELSFATTKGVSISVAVGKYVPPGRNQRRLIVIADEGEAILDLTSCELSVGFGDELPSPLLKSPKDAGSKYRAVIRACLAQLGGNSPYRFSSNEISLRSNEVALNISIQAHRRNAVRKVYEANTRPGEILTKEHGDNGVLLGEEDGARIYYEHQYDRIGALEDQAFKMSGGVFVLTASVFTFLARSEGTSPLISWKIVMWIMVLVNGAAIAYMWRVYSSIRVHQGRAKATLQAAWPRLWQIDDRLHHTFKGHLQVRPLIHTVLHLVLLIAGLWVLSGRNFQSTDGARTVHVDVVAPVRGGQKSAAKTEPTPNIQPPPKKNSAQRNPSQP